MRNSSRRNRKDQSNNATCGNPDHHLHRRQFLMGSMAGAASMASFHGLFNVPVHAEIAKREEKHVILLFLCGAPSQFETWDPKPGRSTGGPFKSIPTVLPGVHFCELMPKCATINDQFSIIRSMSTGPTEHFEGIDLLVRGELPRPPFTRPVLGSVIAKELGNREAKVPNFCFLDPCPDGNEFRQFKERDWPGWLGSEYGPVRSGGEFKLKNVELPEHLSAADHSDREALRSFLSRKFANERKVASVQSYNSAFDRVKGLMSSAPLFDLQNLPETDRRRYGPGNFAQHTLLARHLVEQGASFVMVANGMPWDSHAFNHEIHQMLVPELDNIIFQLMNDLKERGLLDKTLVLMMGEFGRTPWTNDKRGRDHYPKAWSMALAGCGIKPGVVYGKTDDNGVLPADDAVDQRRLFATIYKALGLDPHQTYDLPGLPRFHRVEGDAAPIAELLA